jgi:peroxiredoxin
LADFHSRLSDFELLKAQIIGLSIDPVEKAKRTVDRHKLSFPVAYGVDARAFSRATGALYDAGKGFLHATGFILDPEGKVANAVYSSGPIGRLTPQDCLTYIAYLTSKR